MAWRITVELSDKDFEKINNTVPTNQQSLKVKIKQALTPLNIPDFVIHIRRHCDHCGR